MAFKYQVVLLEDAENQLERQSFKCRRFETDYRKRTTILQEIVRQKLAYMLDMC